MTQQLRKVIERPAEALDVDPDFIEKTILKMVDAMGIPREFVTGVGQVHDSITIEVERPAPEEYIDVDFTVTTEED